jgi:site-specific DNA-cytosine methylase
MKPRAYYNDTDEYCCNWLANLMLAGLIPEGDIDQRSIRDVTPGDLRGYTQCHFFAGLGGWSNALRRAEWPDDRQVWTGSCPCQPFSVAGKQKGFDDERHLWPAFAKLIAERRPSVVFGEQVTGASAWLNFVRSDLEALDYAVGAMPIQAASADADHFRDRYFFVADSAQQQQHRSWGTRNRSAEYTNNGRSVLADDDDAKRRPESAGGNDVSRQAPERQQGHGDIGERGDRMLADRDREHESAERLQRSGEQCGAGRDQEHNGRALPNNNNIGSQEPFGVTGNFGAERAAAAGSDLRAMVHGSGDGWGERWAEHEFRRRGFSAAVANIADRQYLECPDGKWRRLPPPRVRWLGIGVQSRVAKLRAIGNAIDPRPASAFIKAFMEASA